MYSLHLTPEQLEIRDMVRDFAARELKPLAERPARMEARDRSPLDGVLAEAAGLGLKTLVLPEDMGGAGADALTQVIVAEELSVGDCDTASILATTSAMARALLAELATDEQRKLWLASLAEPQAQLAWARGLVHTEIGVNYHRQAATAEATVTAARSGNTYVLNGIARGVTNAPVAGLVVVSASTDAKSRRPGGLVALVVPRGTAGMSITPLSQGRFFGPAGDISFKDCRVPADHLAGGTDGAAAARALARVDRVPVQAAIALGIGRACLETAIEYARLRVQGGRPIIEHQAIAEKLAGAAVHLETARSAIWAAAWAADHPEAVADGSLTPLPLARIAHIQTAEQVYAATKDCAECFGAMSVMRDMPLHKYVEDTRRFLHSGGGVSEHKFALAEAIAGFRRE